MGGGGVSFEQGSNMNNEMKIKRNASLQKPRLYPREPLEFWRSISALVPLMMLDRLPSLLYVTTLWRWNMLLFMVVPGPEALEGGVGPLGACLSQSFLISRRRLRHDDTYSPASRLDHTWQNTLALSASMRT